MVEKTIIRVGLENNMDGRSIAWALDILGGFANGKNGEDALDNLPKALEDFRGWTISHSPESWMTGMKEFQVNPVETFECYFIDKEFQKAQDGYEVDAWFLDYWRPLTPEDIDRGSKLLSWSREDLLKLVSPLSQAKLDQTYPSERWSIRGVLGHIGKSEHWYMNRLDRAGVAGKDLPKDDFERLSFVRSRFTQILPSLEGVSQVVGKDGEFWSPRKMLFRAVWHELDHIDHIKKLIAL